MAERFHDETDLIPERTPVDVIVTDRRAPSHDDPTMGVEEPGPRKPGVPTPPAAPVHPFVVVGDSLTHGLTSGAVFRTEISWAAQVAKALGLQPFFHPDYAGPLDGIPLNLEAVARALEKQVGRDLSGWESLELLYELSAVLDSHEDYWEREDGAKAPATDRRWHNLGIYGWDIRDALSYTCSRAADAARKRKGDDRLLLGGRGPEKDNDIAAWSVLAPFGEKATQLGAARQLGDDGGIGILVIALGANNALRSVVDKERPLNWTDDERDRHGTPDYANLDKKQRFKVWQPKHFAAEYEALVREVKAIAAQRVVLTTVPHVTIAPIAKGVPDKKWREGSRYFEFYTQPWVDADSFNRRWHKHITHKHARAVDSAIDQYNATIADHVRTARAEGRDWLLFDLCGLLDSFAFKRYLRDPSAAEKNGVKPLELPKEFENGTDHTLTTRFFRSNAQGRVEGGLFGLDGIHPTKCGYSLVARHFLEMLATVDGGTPASIDFKGVYNSDTLNSNPPALVADILDRFGPILSLFRL